jgi:hypothetical protein
VGADRRGYSIFLFRISKTIANAITTPAIAAGVSERIWTIENIVKLVD